MTYRSLQLDVGGTITTDELDERPDASPAYEVKSETGAVLASGTATVNAVSTTLASGVARGARAVTVTSASSIVAGQRYRLTGREDIGGEFVLVRSVSGTSVTLVRPLVNDHASGASFVSTRVSCAVPASACDTPRRGCRVEITYEVSGDARPVVSVEFDVTRYSLRSGLTLEHVRTLDPLILKRAVDGTWWPDVIAAAWERIVARVGQQHDPGGLVGAIDLQQPHAVMVRLIVAEQGVGEASQAHAEELRAQFDRELTLLLTSRAFDDDQDGAVEKHEGFFRTISLTRA